MLRALCLITLVQCAYGAVEEQAHYNLKGSGGIRDTVCPPVLKDQTGKSPDLLRQGSPKVISNGPEPRRAQYDSAIKFEESEQCYSMARNLVQGDNFVVEVWAYALKPRDDGWHAVVANGNGGSGFLIAQHADQWQVLVGGVGGTSLGKVEPETWTHLAVVQSRGAASGWLNGKKVCRLPGLGGGAANFSVGATAPGKEAFQGWVAEVRYATFPAGKFDPASDFLGDTKKLKQIQAEAVSSFVKLQEKLRTTPGVMVVGKLDEAPAREDWLIRPPRVPSTVQVLPIENSHRAQIMLSNSLISRTFLVADGNLACTSLRRADKDIEFVRAIKPEVRLNLNGHWVDIGGLIGAPENAFISPEWYELLESKENAFCLSGMTVGNPIKPYEWKPKCNAPAEIAWPPAGRRVTFHFEPRKGSPAFQGTAVDVHYEIYDGLPVIMKTFTLHNRTAKEIVVSRFEAEHLAVQPTISRMLHVESDYSFATANFNSRGSALGIHAGQPGQNSFYDYTMGAGTTRFVRDPDWNSMATLNPAEDLFLDNPENGLLLSRPTVGPNWTVMPDESFEAFRTFEILNDTTERERYHLAQRRFYRKLAPQTNEKQLEVHAASTREMKVLEPLLDQMAELGFEMLQAPEHPGGFNYADPSPANIESMKAICDYARPKGIRVKAYQLMMASQGWGRPEDHYNCIDPGTGRAGSLFGQSVCGGSAWADMYYTNMWKTIESAGMGGFAPDGPYHGDPCAATNHPHHKGLEDSQWAQWKWMCKVLHEGQRRNLYQSVPDWYFLNGQTCTGMGYREATDNIDITLQTVVYRQYIYDATFHKTAQMGWCNLNTEVLHGGLDKNVDRYEAALFTMLSSGAQVWVRGHRLYDGPKSQEMLKRWMVWYRKYFSIIHGDIIHLRRPDGRALDYYLHVNADGREKGMLLVFNPLPETIRQTLDVSLYYTGLTGKVNLRNQENESKSFPLDSECRAKIPVEIPGKSYTWMVIE